MDRSDCCGARVFRQRNHIFEKKTYDAFTFRDGCAYIVSQEAGEIIIEASGSLIAEERRKYVIDMLNNLHRCIRKAHLWLK